MKKNHWLGLGLILLCFSCANTSGNPAPPNSPPAAPPVMPEPAGQPEGSDRSCAYFYYLWGKSAEHAQRYEEALQAYEKLLVCDPHTGQGAREKAMLLLKMDRPQEAARWLEKVVAANRADLENRQLLAKVYTSMGELDKAAGIYRELLAIKEEPQTLIMLASIQAQNKQYDQAQELLERMIKLDPDSYMGHYYLARIYREVGLSEKALAYYEKALAISWSTRLAAEVAEFYEQLGNTAKAIALYERILDEDETDERARARLVGLFLKNEETDRAIQELRKLRIFASDPEQVNFTISRILLARQRYDEAIKVLTTMLAKDSGQTEARYLLALGYYQQGQTAKAIEQLGLIPPDADPYEEGIQLWVRILRTEKRLDEAVQLLTERLAREETRKMSFYVMLASLYREQNRIDKARGLYQEALGIYPDNSELLFEYGVFWEQTGNQEQAMTIMQDLLRLDPDNAAALNYIGYTWADKGLNLAQALSYIEKAVALRPDDGFIRDSLGWVYFKLGKLDQAIVEMEKALELESDDPVIHEHMGDIYLQAGQIDKARDSYEKAMEHQQEAEKKAAVARKIEALPAAGAKK